MDDESLTVLSAREADLEKCRGILERCLAVASTGEWKDAPFPLNRSQAALWHRAQAEAYQHALEMLPSTITTPAKDTTNGR